MQIQLSSNRRHFITADGQPFFWLADTAWNAPLRGNPEQWERYLSLRKKQGFTVIQFVTTHWRGCSQPVGGRLYQIENDELVFNEPAWEYLDQWFNAVYKHGLIPAPVMLWGMIEGCPGIALGEKHCIELARRMLSRWGKKPVVWFLSGDIEHRTPALVSRWTNIGRAVFAGQPDAIATLHIGGGSWPEPFVDEEWYSFAGYQSGHGNGTADLNRFLNGPFSNRWRNLNKPFINLEPCYEFMNIYETSRDFTPYEVRRAIWWSLLSTPTAGVTYGNNPIWVWPQTERERAENHSEKCIASHWTNGLETPVTDDLQTMLSFMLALPWHELTPAAEYLFDQPGETDPAATIRLSRTSDNKLWLAYLPAGGPLRISGFDTNKYSTFRWWSPEENSYTEATPESYDANTFCTFTPPNNTQDWIWLAQS